MSRFGKDEEYFYIKQRCLLSPVFIYVFTYHESFESTGTVKVNIKYSVCTHASRCHGATHTTYLNTYSKCQGIHRPEPRASSHGLSRLRLSILLTLTTNWKLLASRVRGAVKIRPDCGGSFLLKKPPPPLSSAISNSYSYSFQRSTTSALQLKIPLIIFARLINHA